MPKSKKSILQRCKKAMFQRSIQSVCRPQGTNSSSCTENSANTAMMMISNHDNNADGDGQVFLTKLVQNPKLCFSIPYKSTLPLSPTSPSNIKSTPQPRLPVQPLRVQNTNSRQNLSDREKMESGLQLKSSPMEDILGGTLFTAILI